MTLIHKLRAVRNGTSELVRMFLLYVRTRVLRGPRYSMSVARTHRLAGTSLGLGSRFLAGALPSSTGPQNSTRLGSHIRGKITGGRGSYDR